MSGIISSVGAGLNALNGVGAGVGNAVSSLRALSTGGYGARQGLGVWAASLQPASFRGVPFGVFTANMKTGRRTAVHIYPERDEVWVEDLGLGTRTFMFRGFLVGDDVYAQRDAMLAAVEAPGPGTMVHPSIGSRTVSVVDFAAIETAERGRVVELEFTFIQTAGKVYPLATKQTQSGVIGAVSGVISAIASDFNTYVAGPLAYGTQVVQKVTSTVSLWQSTALSLIGDAGMVAGAVRGLVGNFGRFSSGNVSSPASSTATMSTLLSSAITARTAASNASGALTSAGAVLAPSTTGQYASAVQGVASAVMGAANDPRDQVRILSALQNFNPSIPPGQYGTLSAAIGTAQTGAAALCRRATLAALASACAAYQPTSSNDAQSLMALVLPLFDAEITIAADAEQDASYLAMRTMRAAVALDLSVRGAALPALLTVNTAEPQPSLTLAFMLYQDATRADELTQRVNPIHPAFFPLSFEALSS